MNFVDFNCVVAMWFYFLVMWRFVLRFRKVCSLQRCLTPSQYMNITGPNQYYWCFFRFYFWQGVSGAYIYIFIYVCVYLCIFIILFTFMFIFTFTSGGRKFLTRLESYKHHDPQPRINYTHFAWPVWRIVFQVGLNYNSFKANQLIRDPPGDSYEACQESKGRGL
jgi:hypothetical protein